MFGILNQERFTLASGMSHNSIMDIQQDSLGFLWIGTADGLNRFDGYEFKSFHPDLEDSTSVSDSFIASIALGKDGGLWLGTQKRGVNKYDYKKEAFRVLNSSTLSNPQTDFFTNHGQSIFINEDQNIWLGTSTGIMLIPKEESRDSVQNLLPNISVYCFHKDASEKMWIGTARGLYHQEKGGIITPFRDLAFEQTGEVKTIVDDGLGNTLIGAKNGVYLQDGESWRELKDTSNGERSYKDVNHLIVDRSNRIWIGGQEGLVVINNQDYQFKLQSKLALRRNSLDRENIHVLFMDQEDNLWIGTANNGLIRLFLSEQNFPVFRQSFNDSKSGGTPATTVRSVWVDFDTTIWTGSYGAGLFHFEEDNLSFTNYRRNNASGNSISGNQVSCIYRDSEGVLWAGTWGDGLNRITQEQGQLRFERVSLSSNLERNQTKFAEIQRIFEDELNNLWIVTNGGIAKRPAGLEVFEETQKYFHLPSVNVNAVREDAYGNWWVGTWNGLFVYSKDQVKDAKDGLENIDKNPVASFYFDNQNPNGISNNRITSLLPDSKNRIWIGTYGGGLNMWEFDGESGQSNIEGKFTTYTQKDGLPNNVIYGIQEDESGSLWMSTNNGLVNFKPEEKSFQTYTTENGLQSNQFYFGAYAKMPNGDLLFGGNNGFNIFNPQLFAAQLEQVPDVLISNFKIQGDKVPIGERADGRCILKESILSAQEVHLAQEDNIFRFEFIASSFNSAAKLKYAYRLVGYEEEWQITDHQNRYAQFSNMFEGDYVFEVKASLDGKNWGTVRAIDVIIAPPWYRTGLAYGIFTLIFLLLMAVVARLSYVYSNLQNKLEFEKLSRQKEAEINEMRLRFFTYISHEFRTPLTLILSPLNELVQDTFLTKKIREKLSLAFRNSRRLLRLVNQILNFRMINSGKLKLKITENDLVVFSKEIFNSFSDHAKEKNISYHFVCEKNHLSLWFDLEKMELVFYNLLSNAFKFSRNGGKISFEIEESEDWVECFVKDNGVGIKKAHINQIFEPFQEFSQMEKNSSGIGLTLVKSFVELHEGQVEVDSKEKQYSHFCIRLKKGNQHFDPADLRLSHTDEQLESQYGISTEIGIEEASPMVLFSEFSGEQKPGILLVEDNLDIRKYFKRHFEPQLKIWEASDGEEGLAMANKHNPDLIITDVRMPKMGGIAMIKQLKKDSKTNHIPIIVLTSRTDMVHQVEGLKTGALEYLTKPVNIKLLQAKVLAILRNMERIKAYFKNERLLEAGTTSTYNDEKFLLKAAQIVEENFSNAQFNAEDFGIKMGVSRSGLYKKLQSLTGKSTTQFIRYIRLKHAEKLLKEKHYNISQTAFQVGFNDLKYFRKCFKEEFGMSPSEFLKLEKV